MTAARRIRPPSIARCSRRIANLETRMAGFPKSGPGNYLLPRRFKGLAILTSRYSPMPYANQAAILLEGARRGTWRLAKMLPQLLDMTRLARHTLKKRPGIEGIETDRFDGCKTLCSRTEEAPWHRRD